MKSGMTAQAQSCLWEKSSTLLEHKARSSSAEKLWRARQHHARLGTQSIVNTLIYAQLLGFEDDDKYCTAVANNVQEARKLLETGFEYVCIHKDEMLFRKRK
jgi:hypothetical protein